MSRNKRNAKSQPEVCQYAKNLFRFRLLGLGHLVAVHGVVDEKVFSQLQKGKLDTAARTHIICFLVEDDISMIMQVKKEILGLGHGSIVRLDENLSQVYSIR
jgi:hypothetical protein